MSNTLKGILFSALIFPGAGQIILTRYLRGAVFFLVSFLGGILCVTAVVRQAVVILQDLAAKGEVVTMSKVVTIASSAATTGSSLFLKAAFFFLFCCWAASIVDAWKIGKEMDAVSPEKKATDS